MRRTRRCRRIGCRQHGPQATNNGDISNQDSHVVLNRIDAEFEVAARIRCALFFQTKCNGETEFRYADDGDDRTAKEEQENRYALPCRCCSHPPHDDEWNWEDDEVGEEVGTCY